MSKIETSANTKTITFSYRSPTSKKVKGENRDEDSVPRILTQDFETSTNSNGEVKHKDEVNEEEDESERLIRNGHREQYVLVDEDYYSGLDKIKYPFSSKYIPMKPSPSPTDSEEDILINNSSVLLHEMENYKIVNPTNEAKWGDEFNQVVDSLRSWRKLYKILDHKKRQLKKAANNRDSLKTPEFFNGYSDNSPNSGNSIRNEDSEEGTSSGDNKGGGGSSTSGVSTKRREVPRGQHNPDGDNIDDDEIAGSGDVASSDSNSGHEFSSSKKRKTRSTRSSK